MKKEGHILKRPVLKKLQTKSLFASNYYTRHESFMPNYSKTWKGGFCSSNLKEKTKGKMLWLRNNVSTLISQLVDTIAVILITHFYANGLPTNDAGELTHPLFYFVLSGYLFKVLVAILDTIPFYLGVKYLTLYIKNDPAHHSDNN